jgi:NitT/TauT family transport system ATP-binding protein
MQHGSVQEIMDIPLPRPRGDLEALRGSAPFAETRYRLWRAINATTH